jgi:hypothetical protein
MIHMTIEESKVPLLTGVFGCTCGTLPFIYLGLPLGTTKPLVRDFVPLICRTEPVCQLHFLVYSRRLQLVNSVMSSLPTYYMCSIKLPKMVTKVIDKFRKYFLWRENSNDAKGFNLVAWSLVTVQKTKLSLGVQKLYL